eukprot:XP_027309265.1 shieldin complex subunit 1 isoform X4 [Anas platyrhynchos]
MNPKEKKQGEEPGGLEGDLLAQLCYDCCSGSTKLLFHRVLHPLLAGKVQYTPWPELLLRTNNNVQLVVEERRRRARPGKGESKERRRRRDLAGGSSATSSSLWTCSRKHREKRRRIVQKVATFGQRNWKEDDEAEQAVAGRAWR